MITIHVTARKNGHRAVIRQGRTRLMTVEDAEVGAVQRRALAWCRHGGYQVGRVILA